MLLFPTIVPVNMIWLRGGEGGKGGHVCHSVRSVEVKG